MRPGLLELARWECDRHAAVLGQALQRWAGLPQAPSLERIESDPDLRQLTDQILFRFMKLQDAMGERLVAASLQALAEPYEDRPMRDRLTGWRSWASSACRTGCAGANCATGWHASTPTRPSSGWPSCAQPSPPPRTCARPISPGPAACRASEAASGKP